MTNRSVAARLLDSVELERYVNASANEVEVSVTRGNTRSVLNLSRTEALALAASLLNAALVVDG